MESTTSPTGKKPDKQGRQKPEALQPDQAVRLQRPTRAHRPVSTKSASAPHRGPGTASQLKPSTPEQPKLTGEDREVYLAGPEGFTPVLLQWHNQVLVPAVRSAGLVPLSPWGRWEDEFARLQALPPGPDRLVQFVELNKKVGEANVRMISRAWAVLAQLDGAEIDSGTASEIGFASAIGVFICGVRTDSRISCDNEGSLLNLQIDYFIARTGGHVHRDLGAAIDELVARSAR